MGFFHVLGLLCAVSSVMVQGQEGQYIAGGYGYPIEQTTPTVIVTLTETTGTVTVTDVRTIDICIPMKSTIYKSQYITSTYFYKTKVVDGVETISTSCITYRDVICSTSTSSTTVAKPVFEYATSFDTRIIPATSTLTVTVISNHHSSSTTTLWLEQTDYFTKMVVKTVLIPKTEDVTVTKTVTDTFVIDAPVRHGYTVFEY